MDNEKKNKFKPLTCIWYENVFLASTVNVKQIETKLYPDEIDVEELPIHPVLTESCDGSTLLVFSSTTSSLSGEESNQVLVKAPSLSTVFQSGILDSKVTY